MASVKQGHVVSIGPAGSCFARARQRAWLGSSASSSATIGPVSVNITSLQVALPPLCNKQLYKLIIYRLREPRSTGDMLTAMQDPYIFGEIVGKRAFDWWRTILGWWMHEFTAQALQGQRFRSGPALFSFHDQSFLDVVCKDDFHLTTIIPCKS